MLTASHYHEHIVSIGTAEARSHLEALLRENITREADARQLSCAYWNRESKMAASQLLVHLRLRTYLQ